MTNLRNFLSVLVGLVLLISPVAVIMTSCSSTPKSGDEQLVGVADLSYTVFVATEHEIPTEGTFGWGPRLFNVEYVEGTNLSEIDERVRRSLREALESRGYVFDEEAPQLTLGYALAMNAPIDEEVLNSMYGDEFAFTFETPEENSSRSYERGTLVVDFLASDSKTLLWRGIIQGRFDLEVSTEAKDQRVSTIANNLIDRFPDPSVVE